MLINIIILIIGFIILVKGANFFVDAASSLAENFHLSKMFIALTIVTLGTSAPELGVSIKSLLNGTGDIVLGNVIGSNIINILLILGISSLVHPLIVKTATVKKELPITILLTTVLVVLLNDTLLAGASVNTFSRSDGIIISLLFLIFIYYLITTMRNKTDEPETDEEPKYGIKLSILITIVGILCLILGSNMVVDSACNIATYIGVSQRVIALTIVSLGTSLPELVTSVVATMKGEYDIAIGNVVGSNIINIGLVLGFPVMIFGPVINVSFSLIDYIILLASVILLFAFSIRRYRVGRIAGITFILIFILYYSNVIISAL